MRFRYYYYKRLIIYCDIFCFKLQVVFISPIMRLDYVHFQRWAGFSRYIATVWCLYRQWLRRVLTTSFQNKTLNNFYLLFIYTS